MTTPAVDAAAAGIHALAIPTPFAVGRVNLYLIEDEPLTLVDTGPNSGKALDELERALAERGHRVEDLGQIVLTHQHMDHIGLASILARRSGAAVVALESLAPFLADYARAMTLEDEHALALMLRHGIPADVAQALQSVSQSFRAWGASVEVTRTVADGDTIELRDRALQVLHRPGHSPTDTVFLDRERGILIGGDHLLKHISSNPLISRGDPRALVSYLRSLRETRATDAALVLPGHGEPFDDHPTLIDERLRMHARRADRIHRLTLERPRTAYEIAQELWGNVAVTQAFLTLSEVLGHADVLIEEGRISELHDGDVVRFAGA